LQFKAVAAGSVGADFDWLANGVVGGGSASGTISVSGLYTAPPTVESNTLVAVTVTSKSNRAESNSAVLTILPKPAPVAVSISPMNVSLYPSEVQQFAAEVTGTANQVVTWSVNNHSGGNLSIGTISSSGLYTAPAAVPFPDTVSPRATSVADRTKSAAAGVTVTPMVGTTYYLATAADGGNDSNNGLSASAPWLTPNHSLNCGDVILAAASAVYSSANFETGNWGTVNCPTGNNVAWLKCATFDACKITASSGQPGFYVDQSYWGIQGWEVTTSGTANWCFGAAPNYSKPVEIHHIIFANNVANGCQQGGFVSFNQKRAASVDYLAIVGNIAYNAAQNGSNCYSGISIYQPIQSDSLAGTHIYVAGNFSYGNFDAHPCAGGTPSDGEGIIFDTFDGDQGGLPSPYAAQAVADNNILVANGGRGLEAGNNSLGKAPFASIYFRHNTVWGNNGDLNQSSNFCGEVFFQATVNTRATFNMAVTNATNGCGANPIYAYFVGGSATTTDQLDQNWGYAASGTSKAAVDSAGFSYGANNILGETPSFANPVAPGAPNCGTYSSVPACMATVIANFTPTNAAAVRYGYQTPSSTQVSDPLFPKWLCNVNLPSGLVTLGCQTGP
jgi:hypothetical protein